jgi:Ran GTPase-activating protein (RanGAP) involved in mRNA processing and transport
MQGGKHHLQRDSSVGYWAGSTAGAGWSGSTISMSLMKVICEVIRSTSVKRLDLFDDFHGGHEKEIIQAIRLDSVL